MITSNFLTSYEDEKLPKKTEQAYEGSVPAEICDYLCDRIIGCAKTGFFYPINPLDVYQALWPETEYAARSMPQLKSAKATTYLHAVVDNLIRRYFKREVAPLRAEYRAVEGNINRADSAAEAEATLNVAEGRDAVEECLTAAIEGFDYETGKTGKPQPLTAQQLSERLVANPWARDRNEEAMYCLEEICRVLRLEGPQNEIIITAFAAYILADCNLVEAAHIAGISKTTFYRRWPAWLKIAKNIAEKSAIRWH